MRAWTGWVLRYQIIEVKILATAVAERCRPAAVTVTVPAGTRIE